MTNNTADFAGAIEAISTALESMERRQKDISEKLNEANQHRRELLDKRVATLLPDISNATIDRLKEEVPQFASDLRIMTTLEKNRKILRLFKPSGYDEALTLLQARLKRYSENQGIVRNEDQIIEQLEYEKATLAKQQSEALEMLRLMEKGHRTENPLPPEAVSSINSLAQRRREFGSVQTSRQLPTGSTRVASAQLNSSQTSSQSDMDLWLWMISDIPTSFRTLMLSAFSHHDDSSHKQGDLSSENSNASINSRQFENCGVSDKFNMGDTLPLTEVASEPIATDDRLGAFS